MSNHLASLRDEALSLGWREEGNAWRDHLTQAEALWFAIDHREDNPKQPTEHKHKTAHSDGRPRIVDTLFRLDAWAVHHDADAQDFVVTHIPTGLMVFACRDLVEATGAVLYLFHLFPRFGVEYHFGQPIHGVLAENHPIRDWLVENTNTEGQRRRYAPKSCRSELDQIVSAALAPLDGP